MRRELLWLRGVQLPRDHRGGPAGGSHKADEAAASASRIQEALLLARGGPDRCRDGPARAGTAPGLRRDRGFAAISRAGGNPTVTIPASKGPEDGFAFRTLVRHDDPIVRDHRVYSSRIMPGVTFIDLFQRAARACGHPDGTMELRNVVFPQALSVREGDEREIEVRVSRALGHWEVQARSRLSGPGARPAGEAWETNALAQLHEVPKWEEPRFDVERHIQAASGVADFGRLYEQLRLNGILHLEFMKVQGRVHLGPEGALAELELSPSASRHADHFALHPAFLDAATATSFFAGYADKRFGGQVFIPMFLERFRAFDRLGRKCFVHVRGQHEREPEGADLGKDALISLLSPDGALLARFDTLAFKRVRSRDAIVARTAAADAHRPVQPKATRSEE